MSNNQIRISFEINADTFEEYKRMQEGYEQVIDQYRDDPNIIL